jgi:hypothetical protein
MPKEEGEDHMRLGFHLVGVAHKTLHLSGCGNSHHGHATHTSMHSLMIMINASMLSTHASLPSMHASIPSTHASTPSTPHKTQASMCYAPTLMNRLTTLIHGLTTSGTTTYTRLLDAVLHIMEVRTRLNTMYVGCPTFPTNETITNYL